MHAYMTANDVVRTTTRISVGISICTRICNLFVLNSSVDLSDGIESHSVVVCDTCFALEILCGSMASPSKPVTVQIPLIKHTDQMDAAVVHKTNQSIKETFKKYLLFDEPQRVVCDKICISRHNRNGQPLDLQYLHNDLEPNQERDDFLDTRPRPGVLICFGDDQALKRLEIEHNRKLADGTIGLYPPLHEAMMCMIVRTYLQMERSI